MTIMRAVVVDPEALGRLSVAEVETPWTEVGEGAKRLTEPGYTGKAILRGGPDQEHVSIPQANAIEI